MIGQKDAPKWDVVVGQYSETSGNCVRRFALQVTANTSQLAAQAALDQINLWAHGDFSVNINSVDITTGVRRPAVKYGVVGARNRIISVKRTK